MIIKAVSLYQPWARLVAQGVKTIETRSWSTEYRGKLAIQAGVSIIPIKYWPIEETTKPNVYKIKGVDETIIIEDMPCGAVIATCDLANCIEITPELAAAIKVQSPKEYVFGDFRPGRYAWILDNVEMLSEPVPAKGRQRLWNWEIPRKEIRIDARNGKYSRII